MTLSYSIAELFDLGQIQKLLESYHQATGLSVGLFDSEQRELAFAGWQPLCAKFHREHPLSVARCQRSISEFSQSAGPGPVEACVCRNLLRNVPVPIIVDGRRLGDLVIAQFLFDDELQVEERFRAQAEELGFDLSSYLVELKKVPRLSRAEVRALAGYFSSLMQLLSSQAQESLRLQTAIDNSLDGFCILEPIYDERGEPVDFSLVDVSKSALKLLGETKDSANGKELGSCFANLGLEYTLSSCLGAFRKEESIDCEWQRERKGGARNSWIQVSFVSMRNGAVISMRDISERKNAEEELREYANRLEKSRDFIQSQAAELLRNTKELKKARDEAEMAARSKSTFLANMSHEIRTPLTSIIGYTEIMLGDALPPEEHKNALETLLRNSHHLLNLINDILDISKIEAGKMESKKEVCLLMPVLYDLEAIVGTKAAEKGLQFTVDYRFPVPESILSDSTRVRQILVNIAGNAVKFTEKGWVRVVVRCDAERELVIFDIVDTGPGLSKEQQQKLFRPFTQLSENPSKSQGGTGLGLAISRQLAELLGGRIDLESSPGMGTVVSVSLPTGSLHDVRMLSSWRPAVKENSEQKEAVKFSGRVLLVEDGLDNQRYLQLLLKKAGVDSELVDNGEKALRKLQNEEFDLVLMDMQMPVMDGYEATRRLREQGNNVPVVALTAHAMEHHAEECLRAGCTEHLGKPFSQQDFFRVLARYLSPDGAKGRATQKRATTESSIYEDPEYKAFFREFLRGLESRVSQLSKEVETDNWLEVRLQAHRIAGGAGLYGVRPLEQLARRLLDCIERDKFDDARSVMLLLEGMCSDVQRLSVLADHN